MNINNKLSWIVFAGFCGGMAEIMWIAGYSLFSHIEPSNIASSISQTFFSNSIDPQIAPLVGVAIHLFLSGLLALGFGLSVLPFIQRLSNKYSTLIVSVVTLAVVWKINFFVLLPIWNPEFINLLPLHISLLSKLLFGMTMGIMLMKKRDSFSSESWQ